MPSTMLKVGELARRTGVSIRTLHYYDEIGLLAPSYHSAAGHRLYTLADVARLQQIKSLQALGFALEQVRDCLQRRDFSPRDLIDRHLQRLREQCALQQRLCTRLEALATHLNAAETVSVEEFLQTIEVTTMIEKYYTPEQLAEIQERGRQLGGEGIQKAEAEWKELIAQVRAEMEFGTDPAAETMQGLADRWMALVRAFTGGNPGIEQSLRNMYQQEPAVAQKSGLDPALSEYIGRAIAVRRGKP